MACLLYTSDQIHIIEDFSPGTQRHHEAALSPNTVLGKGYNMWWGGAEKGIVRVFSFYTEAGEGQNRRAR